MSFIACRNGLRYVKSLSTSLQGRTKDICAAVTEVNHVISAIKKCRYNIESIGDAWFREAEAIANSVDAPEPTVPRAASWQNFRSNIPATSPKQYFLRNVTIPFIDHLLCELETRFSPAQQHAALGLCLIPSVMVNDQDWREKILDYKESILEDLPSPETLDTELDCWQEKWRTGKHDFPETLAKTLQQTNCAFYPNIYNMLQISATLPVTSCECERAFSRLKLLKSYLRSTMIERRLNGLALLNVYKNIDIDKNDVINRFARARPRRMTLVDVIQDSPENVSK